MNDDFEDQLDEDIADDIDIELVGEEFSQGEADTGKPIAEADTTDEEITDDELARYDEGVQKRIKKAHALAHAERRAKELFLKEKDEALRVAREMQRQLLQEREQRLTYTQAAVSTARSSLQHEVRLLTQEVREAMETGDPDKQILAQTKLNAVVQQLNQIPSDEVLGRDIEQARNQPLPAILTPAPQDEVQAWIAQNPWFNTNPKLQQLAIQAEEQLVQNFGMRHGAADTLARVSNMIRASFPEIVGTAVTEPASPPPPPPPPSPKPASPGMPVIRSAPGNKKVVKLSAAQVNIANELGISIEQYAKEYARYNT